MSATLLVSPPPAIAPLGAGVLRRLRVEFRPICDGRELISPDGRFIARAVSTYGPRWLGRSTSFYNFVVEDRVRTRLQQIEIPVPRDELINWRLEGTITWDEDSSAVTFKFGRQNLAFSIDHDAKSLPILPPICGPIPLTENPIAVTIDTYAAIPGHIESQSESIQWHD